MTNDQQIAYQEKQLATYRNNLRILLGQAAKHGGEEMAPLITVNQIKDTRDNIQRIKGILRGMGATVTNHPEDESPSMAQGAHEATPTAIPASVNAPIAMPSAAVVELARDPKFKYDVFISYSHKDEQWVENTLLKRLEEAGLRVCIDFRDFVPGVPSIVNMEKAVEDSQHTVIVLTEAWLNSEWGNFEALLVQTSDPAAVRGRLIPLRVEETVTKLPGRIAMLSWVDFVRADRQVYAWRGLFQALGIPASA
jgi:hypothetical protein